MTEGLSGKAARKIRKEIIEGTPNTRKRVQTIRRAVEVYRRSQECLVCAAKDAEIVRLHDLLRHVTTGPIPAPINPPEPAPPPLDPTIELWLDARFIHGTTIWRQQRREAEKLATEGVDAEVIIETLGRGQKVDL